jgi:hypothetical protein
MFKSVKNFWLKRKWRKRQSEALPFILLLLALADGALLAETLAIFRDYLEKHDPSGATMYKYFIVIATIVLIGVTWFACRSWIKPMDQIERELKKHKK